MDRLLKIFCPCISFKNYQDRDTKEYFETKIDNLSNRTSILVPTKFLELQRKNTGSYELSIKSEFENEETQSFGFNKKCNLNKEQIKMRNSLDFGEQYKIYNANGNQFTKNKEIQIYPICRYTENELILIGKQKKNMLAFIESVKLDPSPVAVQKQFQSKNNNIYTPAE